MQSQRTQFWNRVTILCAHCARPFIVVSSEAERRTCCSIACARAYKLSNWRDRFWARLRPAGPADCWLWPGAILPNGYGVLRVDSKDMKAHRVAWELTHGAIPEGMCVLHNCDVRYPPGNIVYRCCCNPSHLFLGTHQDNMADRDRKGRQAAGERSGRRTHPESYIGKLIPNPEKVLRGEKHPNARLTDDDVQTIKCLLATTPLSHVQIAERFGVTGETISKIHKGRTWQHIKYPSK